MCHLSHSLAFAICLFLSLHPHPSPQQQQQQRVEAERKGTAEGAGFDCYIIPSFWPVQKIARTEVAAKVSLSPIPLHCEAGACSRSDGRPC